MAKSPESGRHAPDAFTLVELLVVIAIIALLAAILLPALSSAKDKGRRAACISNLHQQGIAIQIYSGDWGGKIPYGPKAPPFISPSDLYPGTGSPTSLISLYTGAPAALGLLLKQQLANTPQVLFCPGTDQGLNAAAQLAQVGIGQAQCSYYYRHSGNTQLFDTPGADVTAPDHILLDSLGNNRNGSPIRALVMDSQFRCPPDLGAFSVTNSTQHQARFTDVLYSDSHVVSLRNDGGRFTVTIDSVASLYSSFDLILKSFETADTQP